MELAYEKTCRTMITTQDALNTFTLGPDWRNMGANFRLAIMQECAEGIDHLGWKWWAKQEINLKAAQIEVVDILHFAMADLIVNAGIEGAVASMEEGCRVKWTDSIQLCGRSHFLTQYRPRELFTLISTMAGLGVVDMRAIFALGEKLELPFPALAKLYFCKAILNKFRQKNGYKAGAYKKMWAPGQEDNDFVLSFADTLDWSDPEAPNTLERYLTTIYSAL